MANLLDADKAAFFALCSPMQCSEYVQEYLPMIFALLKQEVVSGAHGHTAHMYVCVSV